MKLKSKKSLLMLVGAGCVSALVLHLLFVMQKKFDVEQRELEMQKLKQVEDKLQDCENLLPGGRWEKAERIINTLKESTLNREQMLRRYLLLGDINLVKYHDLKNRGMRDYYLGLASKFYRLAEEESSNPEEKSEIIRRDAKIHLDDGRYDDAIKLFDESMVYSYLMLPEERWRVMLDKAYCYSKLDKYAQAVNFLYHTAEESEIEDKDIWSEAMNRMGHIMVEASLKPEVAKEFKGSRFYEKDPLEYRRRALEIYQKVIKGASIVSESCGTARLGELRVYVLNRDPANTYRLCNIIGGSAATVNQKARSLMLLADLEENYPIPEKDSEGNEVDFKAEQLKHDEKAINALTTSLESYPQSALRIPISLQLYHLYQKTENWEKVFDIAEDLLLRSPEKETVIKIINYLVHGENRLLKKIGNCSTSQRDKYIQRTNEALSFLEVSYPNIWESVRNKAEFAFAELLYLSGKIKAAEEKIKECLNSDGNGDELIERLYYLDMLCAIKGKASPVVRISRAKRYLIHISPKTGNYREALITEMQAYFDMEMYSQAINIGKQIYADEITTANIMKTQGQKQAPKKGTAPEWIPFENEIWFRTVGILGLCYEKLGFSDQSNRWLKKYSKVLLKMACGPEVFMAWAKDAEKQKQYREAIRRLDVMLTSINDVDAEARLWTARLLLVLKYNGKNQKNFEEAQKLLKKITESKKVSPKLKPELQKQLCEGLLEYAFKYNQDSVEPILNKVIHKFHQESWPEYWILRSLTPLFNNTDKLDILSKKHEESLNSALAEKAGDTFTFAFIRSQLKLIKSLVDIENTMNKIARERNL
jgi:tetratricopeptide (TPR) repeat protein